MTGTAKQPFWKKELSLSRKPKAEQEPKEPKQPKPAKAKRVKKSKGAKDTGRLVGLKIGASQLAAATVANNGSAELVHVARRELEPGIVVGGELREPERLSEALQDFFDKNNLPKRNVRLGVANNRIGVRTFDITGVADPAQLDNAVRFRAQEALPIPIDDAVLDYHVLSESTDRAGQNLKPCCSSSRTAISSTATSPRAARPGSS